MGGIINHRTKPRHADPNEGIGLARALALCILVCALAVALPGAAAAQEIPRLQGQITDLSRDQVLAADRARIEMALAELLQSHNVQLFVLFVESTGGRTVTRFADEVARGNSLGGNDALLVVALSDRTDALWRGSQSLSRLTDRELEDVLSRRVEPLLARGEYAEAVVACADGIASAAGEGSARPGRPAGGGLNLWPLLLVLLLALGGIAIWRAISARRRRRQTDEQHARQTEELAREANALLIRADEALRDAQEEMGFAEAQFSEADVAPYREAMARASEELKTAFTVRQQLDDAVPEDPGTRRRLVEEIVEHARRAQALLDEQAQRLEQLRDLERRAPEVLAALPAQLDALEARIPQAERTLAGLERYAERSWASVKGNITAAWEMLARARGVVADGQRALDAGDRSAAGRSVRAAQQAAAEAARLLDAIASLATALRQAEEAAGPEIAAAAADVRAARAALAGRGMADLDRRLAQAESALRQAERELAADRPDVLAATRLATQADAIADEALAEVRQEEERRARESRILAAQLQAAETSYYRAADYIAARRWLIGWTARTRLAEAERRLERAQFLAADDPHAALLEARRMQELAEDAYALAREDVEAHQPYGGWGGPAFGGGFPMPIPVPVPFPTGDGGWGSTPVDSGGPPADEGGGSVGGRW